uniref:Uncharacterized protein n=1 Tax=Amphimedon queenslandica TaxID=400682 RepID=A0A1X7SP44_AMPQE
MSIVLISGGCLLILEGVLKYLRYKGKSYTKDDVLKSCKDRLLTVKEKLKKRRSSLLINASSSPPGISSKGYMPFREPLIDSEQYIPSESQRNIENSRSIEFVENVKEKHVITSSVVSLTNSLGYNRLTYVTVKAGLHKNGLPFVHLRCDRKCCRNKWGCTSKRQDRLAIYPDALTHSVICLYSTSGRNARPCVIM